MAKQMQVKLIAVDVDGVLSDGRIIYTSSGEEIKQFNAQDGLGLTIAHAAGIKTAIITGRESEMVKRRGEELNFDYIIMHCRNKTKAINELCEKEGITLNEIAFMGDDLNDLGVMKIVGCPMTPANGRPENKELAKIVTIARGGEGAVREAIEYILKEMKIWPKVIEVFTKETYDNGQQ